MATAKILELFTEVEFDVFCCIWIAVDVGAHYTKVCFA